jgi:hypothetical protein
MLLLKTTSFQVKVLQKKFTLLNADFSKIVLKYSQWWRQVSEFGGAFGGQTHILGGQDRIFKKVLLYHHRGTNILGISPPPPEGRMPQEYRPPL